MWRDSDIDLAVEWTRKALSEWPVLQEHQDEVELTVKRALASQPSDVPVAVWVALEALRRSLPLPLKTIARRYRAGESIRALASYYGVAPSTLGRKLRDGGQVIRPYGASLQRRTVMLPGPQLDALNYAAGIWGVTPAAALRRVIAVGLQARRNDGDYAVPRLA